MDEASETESEQHCAVQPEHADVWLEQIRLHPAWQAVDPTADQLKTLEAALQAPKLPSFLAGKTVRKVIVVPARLVNVVAAKPPVRNHGPVAHGGATAPASPAATGPGCRLTD